VGLDTTGFLLKAGNLAGLSDASVARSNLGLGTMATQASNSVSITGGSIIVGSLGVANVVTAYNFSGTFSQSTLHSLKLATAGLTFPDNTVQSTAATTPDLTPYALKASTNTFTASQVISVTDNTNAALRVTQLGTGAAFVVEDSTSPDSTQFIINADGDASFGQNVIAGAKLNVNGNLRVVGISTLAGGFNSSSASTITISSGSTVPLTIQNNGTGNSFVVNDEASDSTPFVIDAAGKVCIASSSPSSNANLSVAGGVNILAARILGHTQIDCTSTSPSLELWNYGNGGGLRINNTGTGFSFRVNDEASDTTPFIVDASGNVGVKTASPSTDFEVVGNAKATRLDETLPTRFRVGDHSSLNAGTAGTGFVTQGNTQGIELNAGTVVGAARRSVVTSNQCPRSPGVGSGVIPWATKRIVFGGIIDFKTAMDANGVVRFYYGRAQAYSTGEPQTFAATNEINVKREGSGALILQCTRAGVTTAVTSSFTPTTAVAFDVRVESASGTATLFINGSSVATNTNAPNVDSSSTNNMLGMNIEIIATASATSAVSAGNLFLDAY